MVLDAPPLRQQFHELIDRLFDSTADPRRELQTLEVLLSPPADGDFTTDDD